MDLQIDRTPTQKMGRRPKDDLRIRLLELIVAAYDVAEHSAGWKASQMVRIVGEPSNTVRAWLDRLEDEGLVYQMDKTGDYAPTDQGRIVLGKALALSVNRKQTAD